MLTQSRVQADVQRILNLYRRSGRFGATVDPKIIKLDQNRVNLVFEIKEGSRTDVRKISFVGNKSFSDSELRGVDPDHRDAPGTASWSRPTPTIPIVSRSIATSCATST